MVALPVPSPDDMNADFETLLRFHAQEIVQECLILTEDEADYIEALIEDDPHIAALLDIYMDEIALDALTDDMEIMDVPTVAALTSQTYAPITDAALYKIRLAHGIIRDTTLVTPHRSVFYNFGLNQE